MIVETLEWKEKSNYLSIAYLLQYLREVVGFKNDSKKRSRLATRKA